MKRYRSDILALFVLVLIVGAYFFHLFYPTPQLIVTPDFGTNDAFARSLATKYIYGSQIRSGYIPLWTSLVGAGQPILPDAIGVFYPLHLFLFWLWEPITAYNASLMLSVLIFAVGIYMWFRSTDIPTYGALYGALTLAFSGIIIPRLTHGMVIASLALLPWIMWVTQVFALRPTVRWGILLSVIIASQILTNFPQASAITLMFSLSYYCFLIYRKNNIIRRFSHLVIIFIVSAAISAIQLLPSWEYYRQSVVSEGFDTASSIAYSFHPKNILTLIQPFALGSPQNGTYPPFWKFDGSIFWENNTYLGSITLLFLLISFIRKKGSVDIFFIAIAIGSFFLMLGKHSPLYILYSFPPLNMFRVPSRFLWLFTISVVMLSARAFGKIKIPPALVAIILIMHIYQVWTTWQNYHLIVPVKHWLSTPSILSDTTIKGRIWSVGISESMNDLFTKSGWQDEASYTFFRNGLIPNSNVFWSVPHAGVYGAIALRRSSALTTYLSQALQENNNIATISATTQKILNLEHISTIVSGHTLDAPNVIQGKSVTHPPYTITAYQNPQVSARAYMVYRTRHINSYEQAFRALQDSTVDTNNEALVEQNMVFTIPHTLPQISIWETNTMQQLTIQVTNNETTGLLVVADTYYPGWIAYIDEVLRPIIPVNVGHRGVIVPKGSHTIVMKYQPRSLVVGAVISTVTLILLIVTAAFLGPSGVSHTPPKEMPPLSHRRRNPGK